MLSFPPSQEVISEKNKDLKELDKVSSAQVCKYKNKQTDKIKKKLPHYCI